MRRQSVLEKTQESTQCILKPARAVRRRRAFDPATRPDDEIVRLLRTGKEREVLRAYFGPGEYRKLSALAKLARTRNAASGPQVYLLPGLMGSKLDLCPAGAAGGRRDRAPLWFDPQTIQAGGLAELSLASGAAVQAAGVALPTYLELKLRLQVAGYQVRFHAYDWRLSVAALGRELLRRIEAERVPKEKEILLVAHSMGGLVARAALAQDKKRRISKLVQLAVPNGGSFAALQALRGTYPTVQKLVALDHSRSANSLPQVFRTFPSLYEQLPSAAAFPDEFFQRAHWPAEAPPSQARLNKALAIRGALAAADERCFAVVGVNRETVTAVRRRRTATARRNDAASGTAAADGFSYLYTLDGDGTVPVDLARWRGARTWYIDEAHGDIPSNDAVCAAVVDLLRSGDTTRLTARWRTKKRILRRADDGQLRRALAGKLFWADMPAEEKRRFLDPVISVVLQRLARSEPPPLSSRAAKPGRARKARP